jgi:hypothetical protein
MGGLGELVAARAVGLGRGRRAPTMVADGGGKEGRGRRWYRARPSLSELRRNPSSPWRGGGAGEGAVVGEERAVEGFFCDSNLC